MFKKSFFFKIVFLVLCLCLVSFLIWKVNHSSSISINGHILNVAISDNSILREKGLSGHPPLYENEGMLFVFDTPGNYGFWMKDMLFPIDIVWFNKERKIVHIEESVSEDTYPQTFFSGDDSLYVLEIQSGLSGQLGLKNGNSFEFIK